MTNPIRYFLFPITAVILCNCADDFSTDFDPDKFSDDDLIWLNDGDGDGVADSVSKYAESCDKPIEDCLKTARGQKEQEVGEITKSLKPAELSYSVPGGTYNEEIEVAITTEEDGIIRYTTNGFTPTEKSKSYKSPIPISVSTILKARLFLESDTIAGSIKTAEYELKVNMPYASTSGGTFKEPVKVFLACENEKAEIFYSSDGTNPSDSSAPFKDSLEILNTTTVKAIAIKEGWTPSNTMNVHYTINHPETAAVPVFTPKGGTYTEPQEVSITCETEGAEIRYTLDGNDPGSSSKLFSDKIPVVQGLTIKAVALKEGFETSPVSKAEFTINIPGTAAAPVFTPKEGTYTEPQEVSITSETEGAEIRYTLDGNDPGSSSTLFSDKISVDQGLTVKAVTMKEGLKTSPVSKAEFTINIPETAAAPVFTPKEGTYTEPQEVSITSETEGAEIRYTLDGNDPASSSTLFSDKIFVDEGLTIKAVTMKEGMKTSPVSKAEFTIIIDTKGPAISLANPSWKDTTVTTADITIEVTAQDSSGVKSVTINGEEAPLSEGKYSQTLTLDSGENKIAVMAEDKGVNQNTSTDTLKITYDPPPNAVTLFSPTHINGTSMRINWSQNDDKDFHAYKIYYSASPSVSSSSNLAHEETNEQNTTYTFTGLSSHTTYYVKVYVFDVSSNTGSNEVSAYLNSAPVFTQVSDKTVDENKELSFTISASDADGDDLNYSMLKPSIPNASFDSSTRVFSWTPAYTDAGNYVAKFEVTDNAQFPGRDTLAVNITVNNFNSDSLVIRAILDSNGLFSTEVDGSICAYDNGRIVALFLKADQIGAQLKVLPPIIQQLSNLTELQLSNNQLKGLPKEIGSLTNLKVLQMDFNELTELPAEIGKLTGLEVLVLNYNNLTILPSEIESLTKLEIFIIANNKLTTLPSGIVNLTNVTNLAVHVNKLCNLPDAQKKWVDDYSTYPNWEISQICNH